jgi:hypothetical protein
MLLHGFAIGMPRVGKTMLTALAVLLVASRVAAAGPDAGERMQLQAAFDSARAVRVTGTFGSLVLRDVRTDSLGVARARWKSSPRPALVVSKDAMPPAVPAPISWNEISTIEVGHTHALQTGARVAVFGALLGTAVWLTIPFGYDGGPGPAPVVIGVPAATGFLLGALIGAGSYTWRRVYPEGAAAAR